MIRKYCILIGVLFFSAIITGFLSQKVPLQENSQYAKQLPLFLNGWVGRDFEIDDRTLEILETDDVLLRTYGKEGSVPVQLCVVYASNNRKVSHPPEVCYKGSGWSVEQKEPILFSKKSNEYPGFRAIKLIIEKGSEKKLVLYWYKCNEKYATNYYKQQFNVVKNEILKGQSTSGLIRISTLIDNEANAMERLQDFSIGMLPFFTKYLP